MQHRAGCQDRAVRVWDTATGREVAALNGHAGVPTALRWAPRRVSPLSSCNARCKVFAYECLASVLLDNEHVLWLPMQLMMASACTALVMWVPNQVA
jgi:WD40 repeat protein